MSCQTSGFKKDHLGEYIVKDPDAYLDYSVEWNDWLVGADTISTSTWTIETIVDDATPITTDQDTNGSTKATIWLAGGTVNNHYTITNTITTTGGLTDERSFRIIVREK